jgi:hypothetical protein
MTIATETDVAAFGGALRVDWLGGASMGSLVNTARAAYAATGGAPRVTVVRLPRQAVNVSCCGELPATPCNLQIDMPLLLADNLSSAPIRLRLSAGVRAIGAFVIAPGLDPGVPYVPLLWARHGVGDVTPVVGRQGVTGGLLMSSDDPAAPFVGATATDGDLITEVYFDASHASTAKFRRLGIGFLYVLP